MMNASPEINEITAALSKAQGTIDPAAKDGKNLHFKKSYASLSSVWDACREPLSSNGLALIQTPAQNEAGGITLVTRLAHTSGQWFESELPLINPKGDMQGLGSALTYARRYAAMSIIGVSPSDEDDGEDTRNKNKGGNQGNGVENPNRPDQGNKVEDPAERILAMCKGLKKRITEAGNLNALEAVMHDANMDVIAQHDPNWWAAIESAAHEQRTELLRRSIDKNIGPAGEENPFDDRH